MKMTRDISIGQWLRIDNTSLVLFVSFQSVFLKKEIANDIYQEHSTTSTISFTQLKISDDHTNSKLYFNAQGKAW